jgi:hypothetical protein
MCAGEGAIGNLEAASEEEEGAGGQGWDSDEDILPTASLPSLQVIVDDDPDMGDEVDEPPPTRRFGRRR